MSLFEDLCLRADAASREHLPNVIVLDTVDSTNLLARRLVDGMRAGDLTCPAVALLALEQTAGRGRLGRTWDSGYGVGIYVTLVWPGGEPPLAELPVRVPVALARSLRTSCGCDVAIKWPNDLTVDGRKLCGILVESLTLGDGPGLAVIGFGVNHGHGEDQLPTPWSTSLALVSETAPPLPELALDLVSALGESLARRPSLTSVLESYEELSAHNLGEAILCRTSADETRGTFLGFDEHGHLRLEVDGEETVIASGEIVE